MPRKTGSFETESGKELMCPIRYLHSLVGGKWKMPILCMLASGNPTRYSQIKRKLGDVTNMMLSQSLKELEISGVVHRKQYNEVPPRVEYTLTEKGQSLLAAIVPLAQWGAENLETEKACGAYCEQCQTI